MIVQMSSVKATPTNLCQTCKWSVNMTSITGCVRYYCNQLSGEYGAQNVEPATQCTKYKHLSELEQYEYEQQAWILEVKGKAVIGFKAPAPRS